MQSREVSISWVLASDWLCSLLPHIRIWRQLLEASTDLEEVYVEVGQVHIEAEVTDSEDKKFCTEPDLE